MAVKIGEVTAVFSADARPLEKAVAQADKSFQQVAKAAQLSAAQVKELFNAAPGSRGSLLDSFTKLASGATGAGSAAKSAAVSQRELAAAMSFAGQSGAALAVRYGGTAVAIGAVAVVLVAALKATKEMIAALADLARQSVATYSEYEQRMLRLQVLTSASSQQVAEWKTQLLSLGGETAQTPNALAEALYFVAGAGIKGAEALETTRRAAMGAALGMGETQEVARSLTSIVNAYGQENLSAAKAMDVLTATVREGGAEASGLATSFGRVASVAANFGVSIEESAAFIATFTRANASAAEAVTSLRQLILNLSAPSKEARDQLEALGMSAEGLRSSIRERGLMKTLADLITITDGNVDMLDALVPNIRALAGVMATAGSQGTAYAEVLKSMANAAGDTAAAFAEARGTLDFQAKAIAANLEAIRIEIGMALAPAILYTAQVINDITHAFIEWVPPLVDAYNVLAKYTLLLPDLKGGFEDMRYGVDTLTTSWRDLRATIEDAVAAQAGLSTDVSGPGARGVAGFYPGANAGAAGATARKARAGPLGPGEAFGLLTVGLAKELEGVNKEIAKLDKTAATALAKAAEAAAKWAREQAHVEAALSETLATQTVLGMRTERQNQANDDRAYGLARIRAAQDQETEAISRAREMTDELRAAVARLAQEHYEHIMRMIDGYAQLAAELSVIGGVAGQVFGQMADAISAAQSAVGNFLTGNMGGFLADAFRVGYDIGSAIRGLFSGAEPIVTDSARRLASIFGSEFASQLTAAGLEETAIRLLGEHALPAAQTPEARQAALNVAAGGATSVLTGIRIISQADADAQAQIFSAVFWGQVRELGIIGAAQAMQPAFDAIERGLAAAGLDAAAVLAPIRAIMALTANEATATIASGIQGLQQVLTDLGDAGHMTVGAFQGVEQQAASAYEQLIASGVSAETALQAIAPLLGQIQQEAERYGLSLDAGTQALIDQAAAAGIAFPTDPMQRVINVLEIMVDLLARALGLSLNLGGALGALPSNVPGAPAGPNLPSNPNYPGVSAAGGFFSNGPLSSDTLIQAHAGEEAMVGRPDQMRSVSINMPVTVLGSNLNQAQLAQAMDTAIKNNLRGIRTRVAEVR